MKKINLLIVVLLVVSGFSFAQKLDKNGKSLDEMIQKGISDWQIPGFAAAVVKDGKTVFQKAYGIREIGKPDPVNLNTLFTIGSTTKAITTACLAILVDEGKLAWDDPVAKHFPEFRLKDPYVTKNLTVRDLLTHRAGMPNTDLFWITSDISKDEIFQKMELVDPAYTFRGGYIYQNIMYSVAGEVVARVSGIPWHQFVKERIFGPLEMDDSVPLMSDLTAIENKATPHYLINDEVKTIITSNTDPVAPAGSIWSSINDMTKWLQCMLDGGKIGNKRLISEKQYSEIMKPNHIIPMQSFYPTTALTKPNWTTYGLGWFQHDYRGKMVEFHTGSIGGLIAIIGMIPSEGVGFYALGNMDHAELRHAAMYKAFDLYAFNDDSRDWHKEIFELYKGFNDAEETVSEQLNDNRVEGTKPSFPDLEEYVGTYSDGIYGQIKVESLGDELEIYFNNKLIGKMTHWHYDTFDLKFNKEQWGSTLVTFNLDPVGGIEELEFFGVQWKKQ